MERGFLHIKYHSDHTRKYIIHSFYKVRLHSICSTSVDIDKLYLADGAPFKIENQTASLQ